MNFVRDFSRLLCTYLAFFQEKFSRICACLFCLRYEGSSRTSASCFLPATVSKLVVLASLIQYPIILLQSLVTNPQPASK